MPKKRLNSSSKLLLMEVPTVKIKKNKKFSKCNA
jgi:hypothetical protein